VCGNGYSEQTSESHDQFHLLPVLFLIPLENDEPPNDEVLKGLPNTSITRTGMIVTTQRRKFS
jgi:hypothetical protein